MGFRTGAYATIWGVEDKGNYSVVELSTSKKNKEGKYETDFSSKFVRFCGTAHTMAKDLKRNDRVKLGNCEVSTFKNKEGNWGYSFAVFSFENPEENNAKPKEAPVEATNNDDEDDLPY